MVQESRHKDIYRSDLKRELIARFSCHSTVTRCLIYSKGSDLRSRRFLPCTIFPVPSSSRLRALCSLKSHRRKFNHVWDVNEDASRRGGQGGLQQLRKCPCQSCYNFETKRRPTFNTTQPHLLSSTYPPQLRCRSTGHGKYHYVALLTSTVTAMPCVFRAAEATYRESRSGQALFFLPIFRSLTFSSFFSASLRLVLFCVLLHVCAFRRPQIIDS